MISGRRRGWRHLCGVGAVAALIAAIAGLRDPLASMASYTAGLMTLNQLAPPLLLLALPRGGRWDAAEPGHVASGMAHWLSDPWVAWCVFVGVTVAVSLPGIFEPAVANALFSLPIGLLELACGILLWRQIFRDTRSLDADWKAGIFGILAGVPMTVVAVVWMLSPSVLYTPYLDVICRWDISPLQDQRWAGLVMLLAGVPLQLASLWLLLGLASARVPT